MFKILHKKTQTFRCGYRREHAVEFGFLSGRMDFLIKTNSEAAASKYIMLECKGTEKQLQSMVNMTDARVSKIHLENKYYRQTQADHL